MIRKFFTELLQELGVTLPERTKKEVVEVQLTSFNKDFNFTETWEVRWISRQGKYSGDTKPEVAAFTNKEDAHIFANAVRDAYKMLRHTSDTAVYVEKMKY